MKKHKGIAKRQSIIVVGVVIAVIIAIACLTLKGNNTKTSTSISTPNSDKTSATGFKYDSDQKPPTCETKKPLVILYCDSGFSGFINVVEGEVVTVTNSSKGVLDFDSISKTHPYNEALKLGKIEPGQSKSFVSKPLGIYDYTNKNKPSDTGQLEIQDDL